MYSTKRLSKLLLAALVSTVTTIAFCQEDATWKPTVDWGHWRLGHRSNFEFLTKNNLTVTFGSGAPNFENVTRAEFDRAMQEAKLFNQNYHDKGYIVLRYLSTSLNGDSETNKSDPKKEQIKWLEFYNKHWTDFEDYLGPKPAEDPTKWMMVRPDGSFPYYRYAPYGQETDEGFEAWGCPDNPDYVRMMAGRIRAQAETGIDGSYVDWTHIAGGTCYCKYTDANFRAYLKENLPLPAAESKYGTSDYSQIALPGKRGDNFWMEWVTYRGHAVAEFHKRLRTVARKYNPHFMISGNVFGGFGFGPNAYDAAGNMEMLGRQGYDDFIYSEIQEFLDSAPRKREDGVKITNSPALKFLAAASHGKPVIIYATEITPPIFPNPTEKCLSAMSQINIAEAVANHAIFREKRETPPGATEIYGFLAANEASLVGAHLHSNIAILASINQYLADELSFSFSASRVLADKGISHVLMVEDDLLSDWHKQFDLIVLPYLPLLSEEKQVALAKFVQDGGRLIILGKCGVKDQYNVPFQNVVLTDLFDRSAYPEELTEKNVGLGKVSYIPVTIPDSKFLVPIKLKAGATTFGPTMADVFPDIPDGYTRNRIDPELRLILADMARNVEGLLSGRITRLTSPAPYVEMTTMLQKNENRLLAHLVNYDVTLAGDITPAIKLQAQVLLPPGKKVKSVSFNGTLSEMQPIKYTIAESDSRQIVSFELDEVRVYGLAVVEFE